LKVALLILYSVIFAEMLRRDMPQILAQRPMLPWLFLSALRMKLLLNVSGQVTEKVRQRLLEVDMEWQSGRLGR